MTAIVRRKGLFYCLLNMTPRDVRHPVCGMKTPRPMPHPHAPELTDAQFK